MPAILRNKYNKKVQLQYPPKTSNNKDTLDAYENRVDSAIMKSELISQSHD
jgi:hypothetical protein